MKDAFGGIVNIIFIALFLVIVEGVLGLVYNYAKAYKMKNSIISIVEQYEGKCFNKESSDCRSAISNAARGIGYAPTHNLSCPTGFNQVENLFCVSEAMVANTENREYHSSNPRTYRIITQVDMTMPIIDKVFGFSFFQVVGDTRVIDPLD